jgi:hypothetical protein
VLILSPPHDASATHPPLPILASKAAIGILPLLLHTSMKPLPLLHSHVKSLSGAGARASHGGVQEGGRQGGQEGQGQPAAPSPPAQRHAPTHTRPARCVSAGDDDFSVPGPACVISVYRAPILCFAALYAPPSHLVCIVCGYQQSFVTSPLVVGSGLPPKPEGLEGLLLPPVPLSRVSSTGSVASSVGASPSRPRADKKVRFTGRSNGGHGMSVFGKADDWVLQTEGVRVSTERCCSCGGLTGVVLCCASFSPRGSRACRPSSASGWSNTGARASARASESAPGVDQC